MVVKGFIKHFMEEIRKEVSLKSIFAKASAFM
jgi:hypothetical protein